MDIEKFINKSKIPERETQSRGCNMKCINLCTKSIDFLGI